MGKFGPSMLSKQKLPVCPATPRLRLFPEIELDKIKRNIGFDVTIVTTARTDEEAKSLLGELGMPFTDRAKPAAKQA